MMHEPFDMTPPSPCQQCAAKPAILGVGVPPHWMCLPCFRLALKDVPRGTTFEIQRPKDGVR